MPLGVDNFVFLSVGTGVGLGIVIDGRLYRGARGAAGEIGYMPLGAGDPHDRSNRRRGALEEATSASGVVNLARELGIQPPLTPKRCSTPPAATTRWRRGWCRRRRAGSPCDCGGGAGAGSGAGDPWRRDRRRRRRPAGRPALAELTDLSPFRPRIEVSVLGDEVVLQGALSTALAAAREQVFNRSPDQERREIIV